RSGHEPGRDLVPFESFEIGMPASFVDALEITHDADHDSAAASVEPRVHHALSGDRVSALEATGLRHREIGGGWDARPSPAPGADDAAPPGTRARGTTLGLAAVAASGHEERESADEVRG